MPRSPPKTYYLFVLVNNSFLSVVYFAMLQYLDQKYQSRTRGPNADDADLRVTPFTYQ